jgi:putative peptidoglycan lipid II flippase
VATAEDLELTADSRAATVRSAAVMSVGTLLSRATGVVRVSVTLAALGVTSLSSTYLTANTTPNIVYELVLGGILTSVFVPVLVEWGKQHGQDAQFEAGSRFLTLTLVVLGVLSAGAAVAAPWIMRLYTLGEQDPMLRAREIELGAFFLRWFMPQIVFYGLGAVASGLLTANRRFAAPMYAPVLNNLAVIVTMFAFIAISHGTAPSIAGLSDAERLLLGAGTTLGVVAMTVALWPALRSIGFRWHLRLDWRHPTVRRLVNLARWVVLYVVANQVAYVVIIVMNGRIDGRAYTVYSQAFIFFSLPHAIVAVSIFTALLPGMAERWTVGRQADVRELFSRGVRDTELVMLPAAAGMIALAGPLVALLASYGAVRGADVDALARTLAAFAVGLPFFSAFQLLLRTFYAIHDSRTPALTNIGVNAVNLGVNLLLAFWFGWGVPGLALGYASSYAFGSCVLVLLLRPRLGGLDQARIASMLGRTAVAAIVTGLAAFGVAEGLAAAFDVARPALRLLQVVAAVAAGVVAFLAGALMLRINEVDEVKSALIGRFRR